MGGEIKEKRKKRKGESTRTVSPMDLKSIALTTRPYALAFAWVVCRLYSTDLCVKEKRKRKKANPQWGSNPRPLANIRPTLCQLSYGSMLAKRRMCIPGIRETEWHFGIELFESSTLCLKTVFDRNECVDTRRCDYHISVSYTHLTLPTIYSV